ncbi:MAG TPA: hypothetical protein VIH00_12570 [Candidatus Limnocylindrales bacterium]
MPIRVDAYTASGIATGVLSRAEHLRDALEGGASLILDRVDWQTLGERGVRQLGEVSIPVDDVLIAVGDDELTGPVHAAWHSIRLEVGPYVIHGELPTMPGFDPNRALARPTGEFVLLRDVRVTLLADAASGAASGRQALVNRYGVERVRADIMLGFFFPGAAIDGVEPATA